MRIWRCSQCEHGHRAPNALGKTDPRRYCLTCTSPKDSSFVERVCQAAEAVKKRRAEKRQVRIDKRKGVVRDKDGRGYKIEPL